jgi:SlyX protein
LRVSDPLLARIEELEVRVAFQEDLLATLNTSVADTTVEMRDLRRELVRMREALDGVRVSLAHDTHDVRDEPPPPHY